MHVPSTNPAAIRVEARVAEHRRAGSLPFAKALSAPDLARFVAAEARDEARESGPFTTDVTLFAFLSQAVDDDQSCAAAVARINAARLVSGLPACSPHTSSFCKARERLPVSLLRGLCRHSGERLEAASLEAWLWHGRHVVIVDGTMLTGPDTPANRLAFPQHHAARPGLGFPTLRLVAMTSLATGAVLDAAIGPVGGDGHGELSLAHLLLARVAQGDIILGDRLYPGFPFVAAAKAKGGDVVLRLPGRVPHDFRRGVRLGPKDHLVRWRRPAHCATLDDATLQGLPEEILVREVAVTVSGAGMRARQLTLVTTLTSREDFPPEALAGLYFRRWQVELDLRAIKQTMHMDQLRCRSPGMLEREIWAHLLAYNLVRRTMAEAGSVHGVEPRRLSFKWALQLLRAQRVLWQSRKPGSRRQWRGAMLAAIARCPLAERPGRREPRQIKRNPKKYDMLKAPRRGMCRAAA